MSSQSDTRGVSSPLKYTDKKIATRCCQCDVTGLLAPLIGRWDSSKRRELGAPVLYVWRSFDGCRHRDLLHKSRKIPWILLRKLINYGKINYIKILQVNFVPVLKFHAEIAVKWQDRTTTNEWPARSKLRKLEFILRWVTKLNLAKIGLSMIFCLIGQPNLLTWRSYRDKWAQNAPETLTIDQVLQPTLILCIANNIIATSHSCDLYNIFLY